MSDDDDKDEYKDKKEGGDEHEYDNDFKDYKGSCWATVLLIKSFV